MSNNSDSHDGGKEQQGLPASEPSFIVDGVLIDMFNFLDAKTRKFKEVGIILKVHKSSQVLTFVSPSKEMEAKVLRSEIHGEGRVRVTIKPESIEEEGLHSLKLVFTDIKPIIGNKVEYISASPFEKRYNFVGAFELTRWRRKKQLNDKFRKIFKSTMGHKHLNDTDDCYFLGHYARGEGTVFSETNRLVLGMKHNEEKAISDVAQKFANAIEKSNLTHKLFVPVPPSNPEQKNWIEQMLDKTHVVGLQYKKLVKQTKPTDPNHRSGSNRMSPDDLKKIYVIEKNVLAGVKEIAIVDDVVTKGAHFRAISDKIKEQYPKVSIIGLFIARTMWGREFR